MAGFDLTFSAPKSVSVAWAVADEATQGLIYSAHQAALDHVIAYAEEHVFSSRSGKAGVVQEDIAGVVATAFDHWDSRSGDPQLHTHVVVMNRVQTADGLWRTLDSRGLFRSTVGLSEMYNVVLSDYLTQSLGWGWQGCGRRHSDVPKYEVAGVPEGLRDEFSRRPTDIEAAKDILVVGFVSARGRQPSAREVLQMRQQATLATRPDKHVASLADLVHGWRGRAREVLGSDPVAWVETLAGRNDLPLLHAGDLADEMLTEAAKVAVHTVAEKRATFARSNLFAEVLRQFHGIRFASAEDRMAVVERTSDLAVGHRCSSHRRSSPTPRSCSSGPMGRPGSGRAGLRSTRPRTCSTPKRASWTRVVPWLGRAFPRSWPRTSVRGFRQARITGCPPIRPRRCSRSWSPAGSWTSWSGRLERGRARRCAGSGMRGSASTGPAP